MWNGLVTGKTFTIYNYFQTHIFYLSTSNDAITMVLGLSKFKNCLFSSDYIIPSVTFLKHECYSLEHMT